MNHDDDLYPDVRDFVINMQSASSSKLQRYFQIGYARAASLIDMLEEAGVIGPKIGTEPRPVYISASNSTSMPSKRYPNKFSRQAPSTLLEDMIEQRMGVIMLGFRATNNVRINADQAHGLPLKQQDRYFEAGLKKLKNIPQESHTPISRDRLWTYPPINLLSTRSTEADGGDELAKANIIHDTLKEFDIDSTMVGANVGPTVTQYTFRINGDVATKKIHALDHNIQLALESQPIRIETPVRGTDLVGIEVPNEKRTIVPLTEIMISKELDQLSAKLGIVLGRDATGQIIARDLCESPHLLIAGATGSGKSMMIDSIISTLLFRNSPAELQLILVDLKRVQMAQFRNIPHLITPVIEEVGDAVSALRWLMKEIDQRISTLAENGSLDIFDFNSSQRGRYMPNIVLIIDDITDLMIIAPEITEDLIVKIAQLARAVGIHMIIATSRPSSQILSGPIKTNMCERIAFTTTSKMDSKVILETTGAEKLLGKGDMLYSGLDINSSQPIRIQGAFIGSNEISALTSFIESIGTAQYNEEILAQPLTSINLVESEEDTLFYDALRVILDEGIASSAFLQRRLKIGYARAANLIDMLEERGVIGPKDGANPRKVLIKSIDEFQEL